MSNYNSLKATIDANIKQNGNQEITGQILNSVLNQMVTTLGAGYQFAGVATIATNPGTPDAKVFYIANGKGTYEKFGGINVTEDEVVVLYWDSSWHKVSTGIASQAKLSGVMGFAKTFAKSFYKDVGYLGNSLVLSGEFIGDCMIDNVGNIVRSIGSILCRIPIVPNRKYYIKSQLYVPNSVGALGYSQDAVYYGQVDYVSLASLQEESGYKAFTAPAGANYLYINTYLVLSDKRIIDVRDLVVYDTTVTDVNGIFPTTAAERSVIVTLNALKLQGINYVLKGVQISNLMIDNVGTIRKLHDSIMCRVPVTPGQTYYIKSTNYSPTYVGVLGYSATPVTSGTLQYDDMSVLPKQDGFRVLTVPAGMNYAYFNLYLTLSGGKIVDLRDFYFSDSPSGYVTTESDRTILQMIEPTVNKKIVFLGDSITNMSIGQPTRGWVTYFLQKFSFAENVNYARSGATWSNTPNTIYDIVENTGSLSDDNVIYNQVNRLLNDINNGATPPDYIIIAAGTNDAWYPSARPDALADTANTIFEDTATNYLNDVNINTCVSIAKAMRYVAEMIIHNLPNSQVIILTPLQSTAFTDERNNNISTVIRECANYMGWNVIEQSKECGISRLQEIRGYTKTYDGTHTSVDGAKFVGAVLASIFKSIAK